MSRLVPDPLSQLSPAQLASGSDDDRLSQLRVLFRSLRAGLLPPFLFTLDAMWHSSSKIDFILGELDKIWKAYDEDETAARKQYGNVLIFSQWTSMLRYLGVSIFLASECRSHCRKTA